jgi:iron complex transport system ATP-binding protein
MSFLNVEHITSGYDKRPVLQNISFEVNKGSFIGIIGPNGAGKTTLIKTLTHIIKPDKGSVYVEDKDIHEMPAAELAKACAVVFQGLVCIFSFLVEELVLMGRSAYIGTFGSEKVKDIEAVDEALKITDLIRLRSRPIDELSSGEQQRVLIAKALAQQPKLLLLDEPTAHLDIGYQIELLDLIDSLRSDQDMTVMGVFHDLNLASQYCDKILILDKGNIAGFDTPKNILKYGIIERIFKAPVLVNDKTDPNRPFIVPVKSR